MAERYQICYASRSTGRTKIRYFDSLAEARRVADEVFRQTKIVLAIEAKKTK